MERLRDDIKIAEDRLKEIEEGKKVVQTKKDFLKEMEKWVKD